ncbi:MAG: hypothetical protein RMX68_014980 [Aulosira sp. ZfuVER01]|nr:hypothetical protein [Aulosira sp. ZfuVER01]MDZ7998765.1 hypothetical protein [Aulosira sp. DedVER01a]MDZ8053941.1 hypothetical protein [Aulosira sp. ZfuCHP01]
MNENPQLLDKTQGEINLVTEEPETYTDDRGTNNLAKVAMGAIVGATLGAVAVALSIKGTAQRINQTIQNLGNGVKSAADGVNQTVKNVGDAIQTVAEGVNDTAKDVGDAVKTSAHGVNDTVQNTVSAVKVSSVKVNNTVQDTVSTVKGTAVSVNDTVQNTVDLGNRVVEHEQPSTQKTNVPDDQTAYILVPVDKQS